MALWRLRPLVWKAECQSQSQTHFEGCMGRDRRSFGKYQVLARLGQGGMGHVFLAMSTGPAGVQKLVVIKQLREDFIATSGARSMFLDEARISMRLNHPNIVQTQEVVDEEDGGLYLVMEFLDGQPMSAMIDATHGPAFPLHARVRVLAEALSGLHYAHELTDYDGTPLNFVHRDVSPQNVIVTYDGYVKLVDFGVAKAADTKTVTESGMFKGKVRYASPEQALCVQVDRRADIFAVGTMLWEILAGRRMWADQADASVLIALASGNLPRVKDIAKAAPADLVAICEKAMSPRAQDRYETAAAMRTDLLAYLRDQPAFDLGAAVSRAFSDERRQIHTVIDAEVKASREAVSGAATMRHIPIITRSSRPPPSTTDKSTVRGGLAVEQTPPGQAGVEPKRSNAWLVGALLALTAGVAAAIALAPSRGGTATGSMGAPLSAPAATSVHLSLHASPPGARFVLDQVTLTSNPYEADVPRDEGPHHLSIRADGFQPREMDTGLARDVNLDVSLAPVPAAVPAAPTPAPPPVAVKAAPANAAPPAARAGRGQAPRRIDEEDPYGQ
jgi:serine/threonine protein kinase